MWTEWGKHLLNLALLVAGTLILRPLIQENTNKIFLIVGIILYITQLSEFRKLRNSKSEYRNPKQIRIF